MIITLDTIKFVDPQWHGAGFVILCDDLDGVRIVFKSRAVTPGGALKRCRRVVKAGLGKVTVYKEGAYQSVTSFPPAYRGLEDCWIFKCSIPERVPTVHHGSSSLVKAVEEQE